MSHAHVNGIDLYYERGGTGPRLLFFNGSGSTLEQMAPLLGILRARFDLLAHAMDFLSADDAGPNLA